MKNKVLLICLSLLISLGVSAQKHTIYIDDFNSEIKIPNKVLSTIRNVVLNGIQQTNRVNIIDAVSVGANLNLSPLEDARRFRADYLLRGNIVSREATDDGSSHPRYHSRENSFKEKFKLQLDLIRTSDGTTIGTRIYEETGSSSGKDASQFAALEHSLLGMSYEMRNFIENYFKVYGSILKLAGDNGKKAKTVYINLGYRFFTALRAQLRESGQVNIPALAEFFTSEEISHLIGILQKPESLKNGAQALSDYCTIILDEAHKRAAVNEDPLMAAMEKNKYKGNGGKQTWKKNS